jgi:ketosteroid isomerase-like protein
MRSLTVVLFAAVLGAACGGGSATIRGTEVPDSEENRTILEVLEKYRLAVERQDAPALVMLASKDYWEDGGTPTGSDDYGFKGLKDVLATRFQKPEQVRYSIRYLRVRRNGDTAFVEAHVHASWTIEDARGELVRKDKKSQEQFVLKHEGEDWRFLSGM